MKTFDTWTAALKHRRLIWEMARRELKGVNKGAFLGYLWLIMSPLIQSAAYVFIVTGVFGAESVSGERTKYAIYVLAGMIPWQMIAHALHEAPNLLRSRVDLLKQVIYPLETLPLSSFIISSIGPLVSFLILLIYLISQSQLKISILAAPLALGVTGVFLVGLAWFLSVAGVIIKDLGQVITISMGLLVYFSPVILHQEMVGERLWNLIQWNPLTHFVTIFRDTIQGELHTHSWIVATASATSSFLFGGWVITRTKLLINEYI